MLLKSDLYNNSALTLWSMFNYNITCLSARDAMLYSTSWSWFPRVPTSSFPLPSSVLLARNFSNTRPRHGMITLSKTKLCTKVTPRRRLLTADKRKRRPHHPARIYPTRYSAICITSPEVKCDGLRPVERLGAWEP